MRSPGIWLDAARIDTAIARSYRPVDLGRSAGARFTVILLDGYSKPLLVIAAFTRSLLSLTAVSASPTISVFGKPEDTSASTVTNGASMPSSALEKVVATVISSLYLCGTAKRCAMGPERRKRLAPSAAQLWCSNRFY